MQRFSKKRIFADQRVYQIVEKEKISPILLAATLNSSLFALCIEIIGRVNLGDGVLDTTVEEVQEYILCPDVRDFNGKI